MNTRHDGPRWRWVGLGLALVSGAAIALEIVLTRIFSVILWYHYGFMAISLGLMILCSKRFTAWQHVAAASTPVRIKKVGRERFRKSRPTCEVSRKK